MIYDRHIRLAVELHNIAGLSRAAYNRIERANTQVQVSDTVTLNCLIILLRPIADGKLLPHLNNFVT